MHILITGGTGFIGSHTCISLLKEGYKITIIDSLINSSIKSIKGIKKILEKLKINIDDKLNFYEGDLRDNEFIIKIFQNAIKAKQPISSVIHFAGLKSISESIKKPFLYWENNVYGTINLLNAMNKSNCKTIVFSSSASIYDESSEKLIDEHFLIKPTSPYANNKHTIEKFLTDIFNSFSNSWRIANLRYFNPIGAHPFGIIGEDLTSETTNIFPIITKVALKQIPELKIYGNDWPTKDGSGVRDYIHVMDIAEGHLRALEFLNKNTPQIINLNLGTGNGTSVIELVKTFEKVNKVHIPYIFCERRKGDKGFVVANNKMAISLLKWKPTKSLEEMCIDGWNLYSNN